MVCSKRKHLKSLRGKKAPEQNELLQSQTNFHNIALKCSNIENCAILKD